MNQSQPNEFIVSVVSHGEPTGNQPRSAKINFDSEPNLKKDFDLSLLSDTQDFNMIQTVFIDNADNDGEVIILIHDTQQKIVAKPKTQGYYPILAFKRLKFSVKHTGTKKVSVPIYMLNFIISQGAW